MRNTLLRKISRVPRAVNARLCSALLDPRPDGHVLMLHSGRSGSTLLGDMMDQHPQVFWDGEVVEKLLHDISRNENIGIDKLENRLSLKDVITKVERRMKTRGGRSIYGMELQDYHLKFIKSSVGDFISELRPLGFNRFIYLDRHPIRKLVSHLIATKKGEWHIGANQRASKPKIRINPDRIYIGHSFSNLFDSLNQMTQFREDSIRNVNGEKYLELSYDDDIKSDPSVAASKICTHLGIPDHQPRIKFAKTADSKLSDLIENYEEIERVLLRSGHLAEGESLNAY